MCLNTVLNTKRKLRPRIGYKFFSKENGMYRPFFRSSYRYKGQRIQFSLNMPYFAVNVDDRAAYIIANDGNAYIPGFHVYHADGLDNLKQYCSEVPKYDDRVLCRVEYDTVLTEGTELLGDMNMRVDVAQYMIILNEVDNVFAE